MDKLPVQYYANKNAWMTSVLFEKWPDGLGQMIDTEVKKHLAHS